MVLPFDLIDTIVVVLMENRSFDHLLGYLSLSGANPGVDGLQNTPGWMEAHGLMALHEVFERHLVFSHVSLLGGNATE
jgi:phospholipase C